MTPSGPSRTEESKELDEHLARAAQEPIRRFVRKRISAEELEAHAAKGSDSVEPIEHHYPED